MTPSSFQKLSSNLLASFSDLPKVSYFCKRKCQVVLLFAKCHILLIFPAGFLPLYYHIKISGYNKNGITEIEKLFQAIIRKYFQICLALRYVTLFWNI